jgi:PleD family two-component response regulator
LARTVTNGEVTGTEELVYEQPDGAPVHIAVTTTPIYDSDGVARLAVAVMHDVTESRQLLRRLGFEASHDALTGLANRREFEARLLRTLEHARCSPGSHASLLYMDLDQFKIVNDTCGHSAGDELLRSLAQVYRNRCANAIRWPGSAATSSP